MIKIENYAKAYKEVYVILNNMNEEELNKVPEEFMNMIRNNMDDEYEFELYDDILFEEQSVLQETKAILAYIFMNFWGTEEQKSKIKSRFEQDFIEEEKAKGQYNPDELFKNKKTEIEKIEKKEENVQLIEYKEKNIFIRIIESIKNLFKR